MRTGIVRVIDVNMTKECVDYYLFNSASDNQCSNQKKNK